MMQNSYSPVSVWLHWIMLILLIGAYACIEFRVVFERGSDARELIKTFHYAFGISIFALVWLRLIARLSSPNINREKYGLVQKTASKLMFLALYTLMISMPILGFVLISAEGNVITFFGMQLPLLDIQSKELADQIEDIHETLGKVGYFLIGLHALAGLFHHFVIKDETMKRMLRFRS
jgi:cytochrome b561